MEGTVTQWQWSNPHTFLEVDVPTKAGVVHYTLESASPSLLKGVGWKRTSLRPGEKIKFAMYPLRTGKRGGSLVEVVKADGSKLDGMARGFVK